MQVTHLNEDSEKMFPVLHLIFKHILLEERRRIRKSMGWTKFTVLLFLNFITLKGFCLIKNLVEHYVVSYSVFYIGLTCSISIFGSFVWNVSSATQERASNHLPWGMKCLKILRSYCILIILSNRVGPTKFVPILCPFPYLSTSIAYSSKPTNTTTNEDT